MYAGPTEIISDILGFFYLSPEFLWFSQRSALSKHWTGIPTKPSLSFDHLEISFWPDKSYSYNI